MDNVYLFGISKWKREKIKHFFPNANLLFAEDSSVDIDESVSKVVIWGRRRFLDAMKRADELNIPIFFIEDGFIRSISLGLDFAQSYSIVLDSEGIYFDTKNPNDLEDILKSYQFSDELLQRAKNIKQFLVENRLSKYNLYKDKKLEKIKSTHKKRILVVGQSRR